MGTDFLRDASFEMKIAAGALLVTIAALGVWVVRWWSLSQGAAFNSPSRLWRDLRRTHRLSWSDARLLARIACLEKISEPCDLFVEPDYLQRAAQMAEFVKEQERLASLSARLFGHASQFPSGVDS
jgi:hypothetical protein